MTNKESKHTLKLTPEEQLQQKPHAFLIVGIGASAGGIQALQEFFREVPEDSGMAYVVILHLSPDHDSQLASVLQRETSLPVAQVTEKIVITPNHVYVVPPDRHLTMEDGYIAVTPNLYMEERRAPVDIFFRTLADQHGPRAIAVILSGTGANGSMGLKRIKERGGATFVQNPREAEFSEMPRSSIATELVDEVLNVGAIPAKIIAYKTSMATVQIAVEDGSHPEDHQQALRAIFTLLRQRTGHDFSNYKRPTLLRRIERRINVHGLPNLSAYTKFLYENVEETTALLKDVLISVTNFFRDIKSFETLERDIIPAIVKGKKSGDGVRAWVAGCATGEEAYSIAMLLLERTAGEMDATKLQIFATDIDGAAIAHAREGYYTINDLADVSSERLHRFFSKEDDGYRIQREVRETVIFATHNFLKDPPFSHLDLVSCRNVMIYLNAVAQERVVETFHFALKPGRFLFLGNSESVDGASDLYAAYNREHRIFQSRQVSHRAYPIPEANPAVYFDKFKKDLSTQKQENKVLERISFGDLHQQLLEEYAPPSLVVNEEYNILHLTERAGKYLQVTGGEPSQNLLKLIRPELRMELRSTLYQAVQLQSAVQAKGLKAIIDDRPETINVHVRPVLRSGDTAKGFMLIVFEPTAGDGSEEVIVSSNEPVARQLEEELVKTKAQLRTSNEQHDFQAEEMKAANEELQAMNEELRSTAEELETSKEELQSINEELRTVNQELKIKIEETGIASNNLQNLINSTNVGTIFLDRSFRVVLFTPAVREIFNLRPSDYGRPLSDITNSLEYGNLLRDAEGVLERLVEAETEVGTKSGGFYLMRITPYRTSEDRIKGVVITFLDITERKKIEAALHIGKQRLQRMVNIPKVGVLTLDQSGALLRVNDAFLQMVGYTQQEFEADTFTWQDFTPPEYMEASLQIWAQLQKTGRGGPYEKEFYRKDGSRIWLMVVAADLGDGTMVEYAVDISDRKETEGLRLLSDQLESQVKERTAALLYTTEELQKSLTILQQAEDLAQIGSWEYQFATKSFTWSEGMYKLFGLPQETGVEPEVYIHAAVDEDRKLAEKIAKGIRGGAIPLPETVCIKVGDSTKMLKIKAAVVKDAEGTPVRMIGVDLDITDAREAEKTLGEQAHFIQSTNEALPDILFVMNLHTKDILYINHSFEERLGFPALQGDKTGKNILSIICEEDMLMMLAHFEEMKKAADGEVCEVEYRIKAADGSLHWFRDRNAVFKRDKDGVPIEKIGIAQDITERKKVEQELKESNISLRYANENLQQFASIASHDLQEPLRKIRLFTSIIEKNWTNLLPAEGKDVIHKITIASERMSQLIREVLQYSKIAYSEKEFVQANLYPILQNVLSDLDLLLEETGAVVHYPDSLPVIEAMPLQMHQVFYNLLTNAVKFRKKGEKLEIRISVKPVSTEALESYPDLLPEKSYVEIVVADNGIGFEQEYADQIFQIFERLHSVDDYEGTGVGLALCKKIIENHSGHIHAISGEGEGAAFHILLPVKQ